MSICRWGSRWRPLDLVVRPLLRSAGPHLPRVSSQSSGKVLPPLSGSPAFFGGSFCFKFVWDVMNEIGNTSLTFARSCRSIDRICSPNFATAIQAISWWERSRNSAIWVCQLLPMVQGDRLYHMRCIRRSDVCWLPAGFLSRMVFRGFQFRVWGQKSENASAFQFFWIRQSVHKRKGTLFLNWIIFTMVSLLLCDVTTRPRRWITN